MLKNTPFRGPGTLRPMHLPRERGRSSCAPDCNKIDVLSNQFPYAASLLADDGCDLCAFCSDHRLCRRGSLGGVKFRRRGSLVLVLDRIVSNRTI